uniref:non-specific serine/threonine protein kinase n=1 Tax=Meloidogyne hapla TaxID=6305 RepID=A0A1I8BQK3_MELHA
MALGLFSRISNFIICLFHQIGCCFRPKSTRSYCPPEVFEIQRFLPLEGTVWTLGILLYTMLIGHPPFQNVMNVCAGKIRIPSYISKECRSLIENCLQPDPKRRLRLEQLSSHEWLIQPQTDFVGGFFEMQKFWKRKGRLNSLGTARTTESESSEECSYRASSGRNEPEPISIPIRTPMTSHCLSLESTCLRPDSGFDTCSEEPVFHQSFNGSPSCPHTTPSSQSSSQDLFCSLCSSSYYTVDERLTSYDDSPRGSLISSAYFSTSSNGPLNFRENYALDDEEGDLTIIAEHPHITSKKGSWKWSRFERDISSDEDETMILSKNPNLK